jgi:hypothetical protein
MTRLRNLLSVLATALLLQMPVALARPMAPSEELNTLLMHATFRIAGPKKGQPGSVSFGTVFIMGVPLKDDPKTASIVLVTAAHVLDDIEGD